MKSAKTILITELRAEGASAAEARVLAGIAELCGTLDASVASVAPRRVGWGLRIGSLMGAGVFGAALLFLVVALSLSSLPGQPLHPVKTASERVAVAIDPTLRVNVMMDRSWEVQQLAAAHRPPPQILTALAGYNQAFHSAGGDHEAAWSYCTQELRRASASETGSTKTAIDASLADVPRYQS